MKPDEVKDKLKGKGNPGANIENADKEEEKTKAVTLWTQLRGMEDQFKVALADSIDAGQFLRVAITAIKQSPNLMKCEPLSLLGAVMQSAQMGLYVNVLGQSWIIPYWDNEKKCYYAQFQLGYQGALALSYRTGIYKDIYAMPVYKNDEFRYHYGTDKELYHVPADKPEGNPIKYYAHYRLPGGGEDFKVWTAEKVEAHRVEHNKMKDKKALSNVWKKNYDEMAMKTVLVYLLKYAPKSIAFHSHITQDSTVKFYDPKNPDMEIQKNEIENADFTEVDGE